MYILDIQKDNFYYTHDYLKLSFRISILLILFYIPILLSCQLANGYEHPHFSLIDYAQRQSYSEEEGRSIPLFENITASLSVDSTLLGTFYYPWYGHYSHWSDRDHNPPQTWASNFLPDIVKGEFKPKDELYDSTNITIIKKHLELMSSAGIDFGIISWWGKGHYTDNATNKIFSSDITRLTYPGFKWTLLYEDEGFGDPSLDQIISDLDYIKTNYVSHPEYLRIDGKPVIFVYNAGNKGSDTIGDYERWKLAKVKT